MRRAGIVRRIDDLGRVVMPKEIRRTLRIRESNTSQLVYNNSRRKPWRGSGFEKLLNQSANNTAVGRRHR